MINTRMENPEEIKSAAQKCDRVAQALNQFIIDREKTTKLLKEIQKTYYNASRVNKFDKRRQAEILEELDKSSDNIEKLAGCYSQELERIQEIDTAFAEFKKDVPVQEAIKNG